MSAPSNPSGPPPSESNPGESEPLDRPRPRLDGKSIWDWLDLLSKLAIPLVVVLATVGFGLWQARLADLQHQSDQQSALDQQRAAILQTYINNMQDLLLNHNLRKSKPGDEIRQLAREQTLTTLRRLDADRNRTVFRFLQDARLVGAQDAVINLSNADLSNDDLSRAHLSGIDLISTTLNDADLSGADLS
ncbi:MAG TPA: pentapeptide repeat-containing protein, partial [Geobacteraceae bacterium]|nr:pentapeptide repeat-containing protein [Geobacteraceae bacterium]